MSECRDLNCPHHGSASRCGDGQTAPRRLTRMISIPSGPSCFDCGGTTRRAGSCYVCEDCGETSGCS